MAHAVLTMVTGGGGGPVARFSKVPKQANGSFVNRFSGPKRFSGLSRNGPLERVSRKSRNFTGHFRELQFLLYLMNREDISRQTSQSFFFCYLENMVKV